jgi:hypothetical protein
MVTCLDSSKDIWTPFRSEDCYSCSPKYPELVGTDVRNSDQGSKFPTDPGSDLGSTSAFIAQQVRSFPFATGGDASVLPPAPQVPTAPKAPEVPKIGSFTEISKKTALPNAPDAIPNLPTDVTGQLAVPQLSDGPPSKGTKLKDKGRKVIRKVRAKMLRKPVLVVVVGKQLAGPTATALKM